MNIGIDARRLLHENDPTWPHYLYNFISALQEIDRENEYTLLFNFFRKKYADILKQYTFNELSEMLTNSGFKDIKSKKTGFDCWSLISAIKA